MTASSPAACPACGASSTGNFCANCGAALTARSCATCGAELAPDAGFCHQCGAPATAAARAAGATGAMAGGLAAPVRAGAAPSADRVPWLIAAALCVVTITAVVYAANRRAPPAAPAMANAGNAVTGIADDPTGAAGRAPDISNLTPKQQFTRLEDRIDQMLQGGDTTNVAFFMQMSLQAYANLPPADRDIDARYHAAIRQAQLGGLDTARAIADTIARLAPGNLLADVVRATVAEFAGDSAAARAARAAFRTHYPTEIRKNRPEYVAHRAFLDQYLHTDAAS